MNKPKKIKPIQKIAATFAVFIVLLSVIFIIYVSDYYHADQTAIEAVKMNNNVEISSSNGALIFDPGDTDTALIFYPGGKVEYTAYEPLMIKIAKKGILCILPEMPFNLAVFNPSAADKHISEFNEIKHWYIGGHSLGGSMAASYASKSSEKIDGLILLASYSTADISSKNIKVLSLYGSNDHVLNMDSYQKNKANLPSDFTEIILNGGNHAGFGCYGSQNGDGEAEIAPEQQQSDTANAVAEFCFKK